LRCREGLRQRASQSFIPASTWSDSTACRWWAPRERARFPELVYVVVGDDAMRSLVHRERLRAVIEGTIERLGLGRHVRLLGSVAERELIQLYRRSEVFVLPCLEMPDDIEGFGVVLCEAALAGTPVVATRVGGIPDAVEDRAGGFLVDAGDYGQMISAISMLLGDETLRRRMASEGNARVRRCFGREQTARRLAALLAELRCGDPRSGGGMRN
jgi:glycosyltransferase involved in cell wall biosynthesis